MMDKVLQRQRNNVRKSQEYFAQSGVSRYHLTFLTLLITAFFIGWKAQRKQWSGKIMQQIVEVGTLAFLNYLKKMAQSIFIG